MVDDALKSEFIELVAANFKPDEVNEIGRFFDKKFDAHAILGVERHITVNSRKGAATLLDFMESCGRGGFFRLAQFVVNLDGKPFLGRILELSRLESFLNGLVRHGFHFDFKSGRIIQERKELERLVDWGALRDDRVYELAVMSVDIVGSSDLVRRVGLKVMEKVYFRFSAFLDHLIGHYDGRVWHWAGDGGIIAFAFEGNITRAVLCALDIQRSLMVLHLSPDYPIEDRIAVRIGIDFGKIRFQHDTGRIVSDVINGATHLEKQWTKPGRVGITETVRAGLAARVAALFSESGIFEGKTCYTTAGPLDGVNGASSKPRDRNGKTAEAPSSVA